MTRPTATTILGVTIVTGFIAYVGANLSTASNQPPIPSDASPAAKQAAKELIKLAGYTCNTIDRMQQHLGRTFSITCSNPNYYYNLTDKGNGWTVTTD